MKDPKRPFVSCVVPGAGSGSRMQAEINKIFMDLCDIPVLAHTLKAFDCHDAIDEIILVTSEKDMPGCMDIASEFGIKKLKSIVKGGKERQESVQNALAEVSPEADIVLIHDAARPLVTKKVIDDVISGVLVCGAAATGVPCKNTLKIADNEHFIVGTPDRSTLWEIQTPQGFLKNLIQTAHENAKTNNLLGTDDCYLAEQVGAKVKIIPGDYKNIKITTPEDLPVAEILFSMMKN